MVLKKAANVIMNLKATHPPGFVALTLVFAQIIAATGYGSYFP